VTFSYTVTDGSLAALGTASLDLTSVNDAPVTAPVTLTAIAEDGGPRLITQVQLLANASDVDGPTLTATNLAISSGAGILVDNGNGTWTYTPALNDDTAVTFSYTVTDGTLSAAGTANLDITPVNDAPVNNVPGAQSVNEDTALSITGLGINDVDLGVGTATTRLTVANGTLNVSLVGGASIIAGAAGTGTLTLSGTQAQINAALATLSYQGNLNYNGPDSLQVFTSDQGNTGSGGVQTDTDNVAINVIAVNDAPVVTVPVTAFSATEQVLLNLKNTGFAVSDVDVVTGPVTLVMHVGQGILNVTAGGSGVSIIGSGLSDVQVTGTYNQINNLRPALSPM
jgi:hypothetical protein